jgi:hypothetical protein
MQDSLLC